MSIVDGCVLRVCSGANGRVGPLADWMDWAAPLYGIGTLAISLASVVILQYLAYLMVTKVAYPIRGYIDFLPRNTPNAAPWDTWWGTHRVSGLTGGEGPTRGPITTTTRGVALRWPVRGRCTLPVPCW